ncbi:hypothetical protein SO802_030971 [Lithocarpus litseifolius]|uniref:Reverse transcriptase domain-containing protein n=1 Tax=Lithocarpus litseifolius TaxID=425828 RepID=A0AAW2BMF3_9ROSI
MGTSQSNIPLFSENCYNGGEYIRNGFADIYTTSLSYAVVSINTNSQWQPRLLEEEKQSVNREVSEEEIKSAMWSLKSFKALGPDGLHAGFFQRFWLVVGKSMMEEIKMIFVEKRVLEYLNRTHIASIPKIQGPETLGNYRPISLSNIVYKLIEEKCHAKLWQPVKASQSGPLFSHLLFAYDILLFAKVDNCATIRDVLDEFCNISEQTLSEAKSRVYFSPNVDKETRKSLCDILGFASMKHRFASTPSLGKYLGFPLKHTGRSILIQALSAAIPSYVMECFYLSGRILDVIDRVTKPKEEGGLGLQSTKGRNLALLVKLNWRFHSEGEALWDQVLRRKYCSRIRLCAANPNKLPCSSIWAAMKKGMDTFTKGSRWMVGRDSKLSFWYSNWLSKGPLRSLIQGPFPQEGEGINSRGLTLLKGFFNLKSAYRIAMGHDESPKSPEFNAYWIWKANTLPRIKTFPWMCAHNSIGVRSCLMKRGVCEEDLCPICQEASESILHALRDCPWVKLVWTKLGITKANQMFWNSGLLDWLHWNGNHTSMVATTNLPVSLSWKINFPFAVWNIWKSKNYFDFQRKRLNPQLATDIGNQAVEFMHCIASPRMPTHRFIQRIRWEKPPVGWMKLNKDGLASGNPSVAGCRGVIKNECAQWISGFTRRIEATNSFIAKLWGLREGLMLCCNLNISSIIVELESRAIVDDINKAQNVNNVISPVLDDCRLLISHFRRILFKHCYQEANQCVDSLTKMSISQEADFILFESPLVDVLNAYEDDCNGVYLNRLCPTPFVVS